MRRQPASRASEHGRSSIRAATRPSRSKRSCSPALYRSRRRPVGRVHRPVRGGRAPRRRRGLPWQGCADSGQQRRDRDRARAHRFGRTRPGGDRPCARGARRHRQQGTTRRQRDPRLLKQLRREGAKAAGAQMPLYRWIGGSVPALARADAERRQRRRPRAERARPPGIHARPARRRAGPRRSGSEPRRSTPSATFFTTRALHGRRRRGRFRPRDLDSRGGDRGDLARRRTRRPSRPNRTGARSRRD